MIDEISKRRWAMNSEPGAHKPIDAVRAILRDMESGDFDPSHIIIVYANNKDEGGATGYYQAGDAGYHGSLGIMALGIQLMGGDV